MKRKMIFLGASLVLGLSPSLGHAASGAEILQTQCVGCHAIAKPDATGVDRLLSRKGPDLYYAGVKFKREWLTPWLQNPTVIRQGGAAYFHAVKAGAPDSPDVIDTAAVPPHPKFGAAEAAAVTDALLSLGASDGLVQKGAFKNDPPNSMASLLFNKLRGCASCHSAKPGSGGVSGPELYTAASRLQPDYIVEYIRNPQKFDPNVWMPRLELTDADIQKLTGYLTTLKQGSEK